MAGVGPCLQEVRARLECVEFGIALVASLGVLTQGSPLNPRMPDAVEGASQSILQACDIVLDGFAPFHACSCNNAFVHGAATQGVVKVLVVWLSTPAVPPGCPADLRAHEVTPW
eukprot:9493213-Pyramimonas_sp.AAC.1